jgi:hypothetical protein
MPFVVRQISRPPHPASRSVTIGRNAPHAEAGRVNHTLFANSVKQKYFSKEGWTIQCGLVRDRDRFARRATRKSG